MVEAAMPLLAKLGVDEAADLLRQVHHDRRTRAVTILPLSRATTFPARPGARRAL